LLDPDALNNLRIITVLSDSVATFQDAKYHSPTRNEAFSFPYKLAALLGHPYMVINRGRSGNTIVLQTFGTNFHRSYLPEDLWYIKESEFVAIQFGISDCAPRLFTQLEGIIISKVRPRMLITAFPSKHRLLFTKLLPKVYVDKKAFRKAFEFLLNLIESETEVSKIFVIGIADTNFRNKSRSFNFERNIIAYNELLKQIVEKHKIAEFYDFYSVTHQDPKLIQDDGIHLTSRAHDILAEYLHNQIVNS